MNYETLMQAILASPEDDESRLVMAALLADGDTARSKFIRRQIETTRDRRARRSKTTPGNSIEVYLESDNSERWSESVDMYLGLEGWQRVVKFERGFVWQISMNPYLFLEQGDYLMRRIAPLRSVMFFPDPDGDPFPMDKLAASPLLARLDLISFGRCKLTDAELDAFAASPHLGRLYSLDLSGCATLTESSARILATHPGTRKCLQIDLPDLDGNPQWPPQELVEYDGYGSDGVHRGFDHFELSEQGKALEHELGYIPWLHLDNRCHPADLGYWTERRALPCFVPGSPVDAPTPLGVPLGRKSSGGESRRRRSGKFDTAG